MITGIEHTAIASYDIAALARFYTDVLGFVINYQSPNAIFVKAPNGSMLELIHAVEDRGTQTMKTQGIRHLAIAVSDFDAAYGRLKTHNVTFLTEPQESKGNKVVFFEDPDGNYLHLLFRANPLP
ncbi:MAG: VOC family protein [Bryobacterales bacterium]|nr:VOC family protein [Bryobacterales bacterium]